jgi:quinate dehydrogenase (quinone)
MWAVVGRCRGLAYFDADAALAQPSVPGSTPVQAVSLPAGAACKRRILMNTIDARLFAINADNGELCGEFGDHGVVDLKQGVGTISNPAFYTLTSAPTVAGTTVVIGGRVADNVQVDMPGGVIRGFDVMTGAQRWAFDSGSATPNEVLKPGETYTRSSANVWAGTTYDPSSNTVYLPMGSASVDLYGASALCSGPEVRCVHPRAGCRHGQGKMGVPDRAQRLVGLRPSHGSHLIDFLSRTARRRQRWWSVPRPVRSLCWTASGKPLTKVEDIAVKPGHIPGEKYAPTQPLSVGMPQIGTKTLTEADMWGATPVDQLICRIKFKSMRYEGLFTTPGTDVSLSFPGSLGGMNWGGLSADPGNNLIFVNDMRLGLWVQMMPQQKKDKLSDGGEAPNTGMGQVPLGGTPMR